MKYPAVNYHDYLKITQLLDCQKPKSEEYNKPAHEEHLFIITHQAYELWFKQVLHDLKSVQAVFAQSQIEDSAMGTCLQRLERIHLTIKTSINFVDILETMTPMDFLDFREMLYPASGFQSFQWRLIETRLGLSMEERLKYNESPFYKALQPTQQTDIQEVLKQESLFVSLERWLERTPFLSTPHFDFWKSYRQTIETMLNEDLSIIQSNPRLGPEEKAKSQAQIEQAKQTFEALFDEKKFEEYRKQGQFRLSLKAIQASLLILLYRDQPALQMPFRIIQTLTDIDETMTLWRYRHAQMAHRMLGQKIGTGGSSGHQYLKAATEKHKIFQDFFNISTFLIPRRELPELPQEVLKTMSFFNT